MLFRSDDIEGIVGSFCPLNVWADAVRLSRAIEAAALSKCIKINGIYGIHVGPIAGYVTEVEARERQRAAYVHGWQDAQGTGTRTYPKDNIDRCYPSLKPVEPPPLVLSTGPWERRKGKSLSREHDWTILGGGTPHATPHCATPADARALADWLEKWGNK